MVRRITSRQNPEILRLRRLASSARARREEGLCLCEGEKLLREAAANGLPIDTILAEEERELPELPPCRQLLTVPQDLLAWVSTQPSPNGLLFTCPIPRPLPGRGGVLLLEGLQDPGNVGTMLRTAAAFGLERVLLLPGCADPFSPKALRASMGAAFRIPAENCGYDRAEELAGTRGLYAAALGEDCVDVREVRLSGAAVAVGSEGRGLSERLKSIATGLVRIPMTPGSESLNAAAAAAILMWRMQGESLPAEAL